jgi:hypothetical protein
LVVDVRTVHSNEETTEETQKVAEQKRTNRWNIGLTAVIAACAALQFGGIVGQIFIYRGQSRLMLAGLKVGHQTAQASLIASKAAQQSADA